MKTPILTAKLYQPPPRSELIPRPRLTERLARGLAGKLTMITAPAGFGKSTLASAWMAQLSETNSPAIHPAWLALDEDDSDPKRFLTYFVAALQSAAPELGADVAAALQSPQSPPMETMLTELLNEISARSDKLILVLDDYHTVDAAPIDDALTFLLAHLPPQLHLVITTREDPRLPVARLRARGQLTELRAVDLRFTTAEAAEFLQRVTGINLADDEIDALAQRTEGWIAGLQLAALSMQGRSDVTGFVRAFTGDNRYVVDYLVEEVLERQPAHVRNFLLQTAILEQLSGPLCQAVTGQAESNTLLETLERGNLFIIPLDDQRRWFRYHHLFADVLRAHLMEEQPELVPALHRRASDWHAQHGTPAAAIRHALAAEDYGLAASLIEAAWRTMDRTFQARTWLRWVQALPEECIRVRPVLSAGYGWALLDSGDLAAAEARLQDAERWLGPERDAVAVEEMVVTDEAEFAALPVTLASARAYLAQARGDMPGTIHYARVALAHLPDDDPLGRAIPSAILGLAYWANGELEAAYEMLNRAMESFRETDNLLLAISGVSGMAELRLAQGRLRAAIDTYERWLQLALAHEGPALRGMAGLYLGLSEVHREQGNLETAMAFLRKSEALGEQAAAPQWPSRLRVAQARVKQDAGDLDGALVLLAEAAEHFVHGTPLPNTRPIEAMQARLWLAQGKLRAAQDWARRHGVSADDELSYLREYEHITLARMLLLQYQQTGADEAMAQALLARLLDAAEAGGRMGSVIEILIVQALAYAAQDDDTQALNSLAHALTLAEPEGYQRIFVVEGPAMAALLAAAAERGLAPAYVAQLLAAFPRAEHGQPSKAEAIVQRATSNESLIEPLSDRELDVLRLLRTELSGPEIAQELIISLNTVRTHTKNIYSKLGVNSRRAAVRRAAELGLLA